MELQILRLITIIFILLSVEFCLSGEIQLKCDHEVNVIIINRYQKYCGKKSTKCVYFNVSNADENETFKHPDEANNVECLVFSQCEIGTFQTKIFDSYNSVQLIDASYTKLQTIENFVFDRKTLIELNLRGNNIKKLQDTLFNGATSLQTIDLSHNEIYSIDKMTFSILPSLVELNLANNQLRNLEGLLTSRSLKMLNLANNQMHDYHLPFDAFSSMPKLEELSLRNNKVVVDYGIFSTNAVLKTLDLSYCGLTYFEMEVLLSVQSLQNLYLHGNGLKYHMDFETYSYPQLKYIGLSDNDFACEILAKIIKDFDKNRMFLKVEKFVIDSKNLRGVRCV